MLGGKTSPSPSEQDNSLWPCLLVAVCKAILCRPVTFLHLIHRFSLSALIFQAPWSTAQAQAIAQGPKVYPLGARLGRARPLLQCRYAIWTGLRSALLRRCGLRRELCCCRSSRRISDSYFLLEMLGSAAPQIFRIKRSRFIPLDAGMDLSSLFPFLPFLAGDFVQEKSDSVVLGQCLAMLARCWAEDNRLSHSIFPLQKCIPAISFIKTRVKYAVQRGPKVFWVSDCIPQGIRVSLVWY